MKKSILEGKQILAVDGDPQVLQTLEREILRACPNCRFDKSTTYIHAVERMISLTYDLVVLDITMGRGFDLLNLAVTRNFPAAMLAGNPLDPNALRRSIEMGVRAYLPKEKLQEIVPFLEGMLTYEDLPAWERLFHKMRVFFGSILGSNSERRISYSGQGWANEGYRLNSH